MQTRSELGVAIAIEGSGATLEGLLAAGPEGAGGALIAPPHPLYGGTIESPVVPTSPRGWQRITLWIRILTWSLER